MFKIFSSPTHKKLVHFISGSAAPGSPKTDRGVTRVPLDAWLSELEAYSEFLNQVKLEFDTLKSVYTSQRSKDDLFKRSEDLHFSGKNALATLLKDNNVEGVRHILLGAIYVRDLIDTLISEDPSLERFLKRGQDIPKDSTQSVVVATGCMHFLTVLERNYQMDELQLAKNRVFREILQENLIANGELSYAHEDAIRVFFKNTYTLKFLAKVQFEAEQVIFSIKERQHTIETQLKKFRTVVAARAMAIEDDQHASRLLERAETLPDGVLGSTLSPGAIRRLRQQGADLEDSGSSGASSEVSPARLRWRAQRRQVQLEKAATKSQICSLS